MRSEPAPYFCIDLPWDDFIVVVISLLNKKRLLVFIFCLPSCYLKICIFSFQLKKWYMFIAENLIERKKGIKKKTEITRNPIWC